jgi:predicted Zn-dependent protease with MMP-like domain
MRLANDEFDRLVEQALESLPPAFARRMENVIVEVQALPGRALLRSMGVKPGQTLLGCYHGVPLTRKSVESACELPERILIFKDPIEAVCRTREEIVEQVRQTVLHEIGHHFGMDEDDLDELGYG